MKLTLVTSLLLATATAPSAHASLSPAIHRHLDELQMRLKSANDAKFKLPSGIPGFSPDRSQKGFNRRTQSACNDESSEKLNAAMDMVRDTYYDEIVCEGKEAAPICTWDFSDAVANGALTDAEEICFASNEGALFTFHAEISCEDDGSSFTYVNSPFTCLSDCADYSLAESFVPFVVPAGLFVGRNETDEACKWESFSMNRYSPSIYQDDMVMGDDDAMAVDNDDVTAVEDDAISNADDEIFDDDAGNPFNGVCSANESETYAQAFGALYLMNFDKIVCEEDNPSNCDFDLSQALADGMMDTLVKPCAEGGGQLYMTSFTQDCGNAGVSSFKSIPNCLINCSVEFLSTFFFVEGGLAGDNCTFTEVGDIYLYGEGEKEEEEEEEGDDVVDVGEDDTPPVGFDDTLFEDDLIDPTPIGDDGAATEDDAVTEDDATDTGDGDDGAEDEDDTAMADDEGDDDTKMSPKKTKAPKAPKAPKGTKKRPKKVKSDNGADHGHDHADHDSADHDHADHDSADHDHDHADHDSADHDSADHDSADHDHDHADHDSADHDHADHEEDDTAMADDEGDDGDMKMSPKKTKAPKAPKGTKKMPKKVKKTAKKTKAPTAV